MNAVVTGATGFVGKALCARLTDDGHTVTALSRDASRASAILGDRVGCVAWGKDADDTWKHAVAEADTVFHLAGEPVASRRWNPDVKEKIRRSRIESTRAVVDAMRNDTREGRTLVSASAVGYYGERGTEPLVEPSPPGESFLADVCRQWESEALRATEFGVRVAVMRVGIVLGREGALRRILYPLPLPLSPWKFGLGGRIGTGEQIMPWIHLDDAVGIFVWAALTDYIKGPVNVVAPLPTSNRAFTQALARVLRRPTAAPVPAAAVRMLLGELADEVLASQRVLPRAASDGGYEFLYNDVESALRAILRKQKQSVTASATV